MTDARRIEHFAERLDALGPDLSRWPKDEAAEAHRLMALSAEARARHAEADRLAELVAEAARAEVPSGFAFRVVADVAARRSDRLSWLTASPQRFGLAGAGFCAAALALGVALGAASVPVQADSTDLDLGSAFTLSLADSDF